VRTDALHVTVGVPVSEGGGKNDGVDREGEHCIGLRGSLDDRSNADVLGHRSRIRDLDRSSQ
jgi:hypothetical protein